MIVRDVIVSMKATKQLKEEHRGVLLALSILEEINKKLKKGEKVNPEHLDQLLEFIRVFVDKCHHSKEEDLLFPAMEKAGIPNEGGPIGMMLEEHNLGRNYVKNFAKAIEDFKAGDPKAGKKIIENTNRYIALLRDHIDKEDNILYMMADMHLSPKKQTELLKQFDKVEEERIGAGRHEKFHQMLDKLKTVYLD